MSSLSQKSSLSRRINSVLSNSQKASEISLINRKGIDSVSESITVMVHAATAFEGRYVPYCSEETLLTWKDDVEDQKCVWAFDCVTTKWTRTLQPG